MRLKNKRPARKADNSVRLNSAATEPKSLAAYYIMARFGVSASLANTIAALAMFGGAL